MSHHPVQKLHYRSAKIALGKCKNCTTEVQKLPTYNKLYNKDNSKEYNKLYNTILPNGESESDDKYNNDYERDYDNYVGTIESIGNNSTNKAKKC